ncbi:hypothetical protein AVEN_269642-1 [Araneus ventricosus]|uniref:Uncharacterized protein n=1 Tax=Araneus ventricosus TaxID=182803 RepID=A0A4Y2CQR2_ARAVE|nr:hypothetical protein AVEN_269642-1 [Araneus ventricosus]
MEEVRSGIYGDLSGSIPSMAGFSTNMFVLIDNVGGAKMKYVKSFKVIESGPYRRERTQGEKKEHYAVFFPVRNTKANEDKEGISVAVVSMRRKKMEYQGFLDSSQVVNSTDRKRKEVPG